MMTPEERQQLEHLTTVLGILIHRLGGAVEIRLNEIIEPEHKVVYVRDRDNLTEYWQLL